METRLAHPVDYGPMFTLQRAAFVEEARLYETPFVPSLDETLDQLRDRLDVSTSWVTVDGHRVVGAVSLRTYRGSTPNIERLMVAPDRRGHGISRLLLAAAEDHARDLGHNSLQLIVGDLATSNRAIYAHLGWREVSTERLAGFDHVVLHTMVKDLS